MVSELSKYQANPFFKLFDIYKLFLMKRVSLVAIGSCPALRLDQYESYLKLFLAQCMYLVAVTQKKNLPHWNLLMFGSFWFIGLFQYIYLVFTAFPHLTIISSQVPK